MRQVSRVKRPLSASEVLDRRRKLREWLGTEYASRYFDSFFGSVADRERAEGGKDWLDKAAQAVTRMIHPAGTPDEYIGMVRKDLFTGLTYQVTSEMVEAVDGLYQETRKRVSSLQPAEVPYPHGFVWFDQPPALFDMNGKLTKFRAISWGIQPVEYKHGLEGLLQHGSGMRLAMWSWTGDVDDNWTAAARDYWLQSEESSGANLLILLHATIMPFGERFGGRAIATVDDFVSWVHALWILMGTEIVATSRPGIRQHVMRRFQESMSAPPEVNVIKLRQVMRSKDPDAEPLPLGPVNWRFRWLVQGHHRHLEEYIDDKHHAIPDPAAGNTRCATCSARITWVRPHLKGPEGKPIRSAEQLYRLQR